MLRERRTGQQMAFRFQIDLQSTAEVHRDPGGHYHHLTVVGGTLLSGTVHIGDHIAVPGWKGPLVGTVLGLAAPGCVLGEALEAHDAPPMMGMALRAPAPPRELIRGGVATACDPEELQRLVRDLLARQPSVFFHHQRRDPALGRCGDCAMGLQRVAGIEEILRELLVHDERAIADGASAVLGLLGRPSGP
jgi:hypothetical protein